MDPNLRNLAFIDIELTNKVHSSSQFTTLLWALCLFLDVKARILIEPLKREEFKFGGKLDRIWKLRDHGLLNTRYEFDNETQVKHLTYRKEYKIVEDPTGTKNSEETLLNIM